MSTGTTIFTNGRLLLTDRTLDEGMVIVRDGIIEYAGKPKARVPAGATVVNAQGGFLSPGFVDIHVHGGDGADFMDGTPDAVRTVIGCHVRHGTTTIFPTTTTGAQFRIENTLRAVSEVKAAWKPEHGSRIAGVHLYGPFFAPDKLGAHPKGGRRDPTRAEYDRYFAMKIVSIATCAAELPRAAEFYKAARRNLCLVTCGHSNSTWPEMAAAFRHGMRHVDHFWCAMSSVSSLRPRCGTPMQASMEQFVLANPEMSTEVIADGCHLSGELLNFAWQMKGPKRLCLVTDTSRALDMPKGRYRIGNGEEGEWFLHDGKVGRNLDGKGLASSTAGMDRMVRTMARATKAPLHEVVRMASLTPAERTGIAHECGSLERGKRADVVVLDKRLQPRRVYVGGVQVHLAKE